MSTLSQFFVSKPSEIDLALGNSKPFVGGVNICYQGTGVLWVVSPSHAQVSRTWYCRNDANTRAQAVTGCTTWFVPTISQLLNPGYSCRTFWDTFSSARYWSDTEFAASCACLVSFVTGNSGNDSFNYYRRTKGVTYCVRAFRCVTY